MICNFFIVDFKNHVLFLKQHRAILTKYSTCSCLSKNKSSSKLLTDDFHQKSPGWKNLFLKTQQGYSNKKKTREIFDRNQKSRFSSTEQVTKYFINSNIIRKPNFVKKNYPIITMRRSNQDTCLMNKPLVSEGDWVQSGDVLTDCANSVGGDLSLGQNIFVAYMPWEGYNFEDAILVSERLVIDDLFTSVHIERYEMENIQKQANKPVFTYKKQSLKRFYPFLSILRSVKKVNSYHLYRSRFFHFTSFFEPLTLTRLPLPKPSSFESQKSYKTQRVVNTRSMFKEHSSKNSKSFFKSVKSNQMNQKFNFKSSDFVFLNTNFYSKKKTKTKSDWYFTELIPPRLCLKKKKLLNDDMFKLPPAPVKLSIPNYQKIRTTKPTKQVLNLTNKKKLFITSEISLNSIKKKETPKNKIEWLSNSEQITRNVPNISPQQIEKLDLFGIVRLGSWVEEGDILIGKTTPVNKTQLTPYQKLLYAILDHKIQPYRDSSLRAPRGIKAKVIDIKCFSVSNSTKSTKIRDVISPKFFKNDFKKILFKSNRGLHSVKHIIKQIKMNSFLPKFKWIPNHTDFFGSVNPDLIFKQNVFQFPLLTPSRQSRKLFDCFNQRQSLHNVDTIHIYLAEKRKVQIGDKMSGRHGNKGIISQILPIQDMPFLPDGTPIDMVLNPLGVPSRMNVGQIYECLLGLAGHYLGEHYRVSSFDESFGPEASRSLVFNKLYEARCKTGLKWLFNPKSPGKVRIFDGRTGDCYHQSVTVGQTYMLRLVHMVDDKLHMRSTGPYSLVTQQPLRGRSKQGGQRLGEMEVWAIEGYGAAFTLLEMLTIKSDDLTGRMTLWSNFIFNRDLNIGTPEAFKVLICELQSLCLDIGLYY